MADLTFDVPQAATVRLDGGLDSVVALLRFDVPAAALVLVDCGAVSFAPALVFDVPGGAEIDVGCGSADFAWGIAFYAPGGAVIDVESGPPEFERGLVFEAPGAGEVVVDVGLPVIDLAMFFDAPGSATVDVDVPQADFDLVDLNQTFDVPGAADVEVTAGPAEFALLGLHNLIFEAPGAATVVAECSEIAVDGGVSLAPLPPLFPWDPDHTEPIVEQLGYPTGLYRGDAGREQRLQLREKPVGQITFRLTLIEPGESQEASALLYARQGLPVSLPRWSHPRDLEDTASAGLNDIPVDTATAPFRVGGLVALWRSPTEWELVRVGGLLPSAVITVEPLRSTWTRPGTLVYPVEVGRVPEAPEIGWENQLIIGAQLTFDLEFEYPV